jgi:hypothetical protein
MMMMMMTMTFRVYHILRMLDWGSMFSVNHKRHHAVL